METTKQQIFQLPYYVSNGGDGSAIVFFLPTKKEAIKADESQSEGWGESSAGVVRLKVENGNLYFEGYDANHKRVWRKVKEVKETYVGR